MGEASEWIWAGVGSGQGDLSQVLPFPPRPLPDTVLSFSGAPAHPSKLGPSAGP